MIFGMKAAGENFQKKVTATVENCQTEKINSQPDWKIAKSYFEMIFSISWFPIIKFSKWRLAIQENCQIFEQGIISSINT